MHFCLQDPSYKDSLFLNESIMMASKNASIGGGAYAFASRSGIELLFGDDAIKFFLEKGHFFLIVGMDDITNIKALQTLKALEERYNGHLTVKAYIHNSRGSTFHPKYCWFKHSEGGVLIIGSGNLTEQGLRHNREAYSVVDCTADEFSSVENEWDRWVEHSSPFLFNIDDSRVLKIAAKNATKAREVALAKRAVTEATEATDDNDLKELFQRQPKNHINKKKKKFPAKDYNPESPADQEEINRSPVLLDFDEDSGYWQLNPKNTILVAEIPKSGNRWKQVNFSKDTFETFFGATCGENGIYRILLKSINAKGIMGDTEVRPSVSVSSSNYRFELDAASGLDYPNDGNRPIGVFAKVAERDFLYQIIMPSEAGYESLTSALDRRKPRSSKMRRLIYSCKDISEETPELAIWNRIDKENYDEQ